MRFDDENIPVLKGSHCGTAAMCRMLIKGRALQCAHQTSVSKAVIEVTRTNRGTMSLSYFDILTARQLEGKARPGCSMCDWFETHRPAGHCRGPRIGKSPPGAWTRYDSSRTNSLSVLTTMKTLQSVGTYTVQSRQFRCSIDHAKNLSVVLPMQYLVKSAGLCLKEVTFQMYSCVDLWLGMLFTTKKWYEINRWTLLSLDFWWYCSRHPIRK